MTGNINLLTRRSYDTRSYGNSSIGSELSKWSQKGYQQMKQDPSYRQQNSSPIQSGRLCPRRFLEKYSLPRVVRVVPQEPGESAVLSGQLLMYSHYRAGKVEARSYSRVRGSSTLVIPENYQGWFSVVTERGQMKARCYSSVQRLVSSQVTSFLIVNDVTAYTLNSRTNLDGRRQQYTKTTVSGGQVLKLIAVYQDLGAQTAKSKRLSWPLLTRTDTSRYAQCLTNTDQVLFIPLTTTGQFYAVATAANTNEDTVGKVYQLPKLLRTFPLPVRVCIVNSCKPQGSMLLENYRKEEVILTCLLDPPNSSSSCTDDKQFRLLEIDVNSKFYVIRPTERISDERRLFQSDRVQSALRFCHENWDKWSRQLKVIHHIYPREVSPHHHPPLPPEMMMPQGQHHLQQQQQQQQQQQLLHHHHQLANIKKPAEHHRRPPLLQQPQQQAKPQQQQRRKISLGDKKTVKSASFRFSTSYQPEEGHTPRNRPLPQRPGEDDQPSEHIYSNVPDEEPMDSRPSSPCPSDTQGSDSDDSCVKPPIIPADSSRPRYKNLMERKQRYCTRITVNSTADSASEIGSYVDDGLRKALEDFKPFYRTRLHVGSDNELPYSAVRDEIRHRQDDDYYAEIGSTTDSRDAVSRGVIHGGMSSRFQRYRFERAFTYQSSSDGTYSGTSSSNATSSMS